MVRPVRAMILAAGRGERMRPLTDTVPKPLLPVGGKPLIEWHIEKLAAAGFGDLVINVAHRGRQIIEALGDGRRWGVRVHYSDEGEGQALETGGGICKALPLFAGQPFLVINGDVWSSIDYSALELPDSCLAHLVLVPNPDHHPRGDFALRDGRVFSQGDPLWTFSGIGVYDPQMFSGCRAEKFPLAPLLRDQMQESGVSGECFTGTWIDVGTVERLHRLEQTLGES